MNKPVGYGVKNGKGNNINNRLNVNNKLNGTNRKYLLKLVAKRYLPKHITTRRKKGFGIPFSDWARNQIKIGHFDIGCDYSHDKFNKLMDEHKLNQKDRRLFLWAWYSLQNSQIIRSVK